MFRVDRWRAWSRAEPVAENPGVSAASAVACLYRHWRTAGAELERLAQGLTRRRFDEGLQALERACASIRVADELVEVIELASWEHASGPATANQLRRELLAEIVPWLEAARRELPAAASTLCSFATDLASREAALAALRQLVRLPTMQRRKLGL
jgi:hypothetical protein